MYRMLFVLVVIIWVEPIGAQEGPNPIKRTHTRGASQFFIDNKESRVISLGRADRENSLRKWSLISYQSEPLDDTLRKACSYAELPDGTRWAWCIEAEDRYNIFMRDATAEKPVKFFSIPIFGIMTSPYLFLDADSQMLICVIARNTPELRAHIYPLRWNEKEAVKSQLVDEWFGFRPCYFPEHSTLALLGLHRRGIMSWNIQTQDRHAFLIPKDREIGSMVNFTIKQGVLVGLDNGQILQMDFKDRSQKVIAELPKVNLTALELGRDEASVFVGDGKGAVHILDLRTGKVKLNWHKESGYIAKMAWLPKSQRLIVSTLDEMSQSGGRIVILDASSEAQPPSIKAVFEADRVTAINP